MNLFPIGISMTPKRTPPCRRPGIFIFYIPFLIPFFIDIIYYFTAPVIPSAKFFCKIKNTKAVGNVHIKTANISIP